MSRSGPLATLLVACLLLAGASPARADDVPLPPGDILGFTPYPPAPDVLPTPPAPSGRQLGPSTFAAQHRFGAAERSSTGPSCRVGGQIFSNFHLPTSRFEPEGFDLTRARIYANGVFNQTWSGRVVLNTRALTLLGAAGKVVTLSHDALLKMAYLQAQGLLPGSRIQMGMIVSPWFEYESSAWGYRMLGLVPSAGGFTATPGPSLVPFYDLGLSLAGNEDLFDVPSFFGYALAVTNGEGNTATETDGQLDYEGRLTLQPVPGLEFTGIAHKGNPGGAGPAFERYAGLVLIRGGWGRLAAEGNWSHDDGPGGIGDGRILGAWAVIHLPFFPLPTQLVLRGDRIDGGPTPAGAIDLAPADGFRYETIAGIAFRPVRQITLMLDNENADWHRVDGSAYRNTDQVALNTQVTF